MIRPAVVVATYERPRELMACLESLAAQSHPEFEIIVADDGSTDATRRAVESFSAVSRRPVQHVWQEDEGFRLAAIRNRAIRATEAEYLIFLDGDCIAPTRFVAGHARLAERGFFVRGTRVRMNAAVSEEALREGAKPHEWSMARWVREWRAGRIDRVLPLLRLPMGPLRKSRPREWRRVVGCNLAVWRDDLVSVNGFDESFVGWGSEDFDLVIRLLRRGIRRKEGRYATPVLHLWHPEGEENPDNAIRLEELLASERVRARRGIDQPG